MKSEGRRGGRPGVEPQVAALALLHRGRDVDEEEAPAARLDGRPHVVPDLGGRGDRAAQRHAAVVGDLGG